MKRKIALAVLVLGAVYLLTWPVPISPVAWSPAEDPGHTGVYAANEALVGLERLSLGDLTGPEGAAVGPDGRLYVTSHEGVIVRFAPGGQGGSERFADTEGRPLGLAFAPGGPLKGHLFVADAYKGLLSVSPEGKITKHTISSEGLPIGFADDLDVAQDGRVYFSDASWKFKPADMGGTLPASKADIIEHGGRGRLLMWDPRTKKTQTLLSGLQFANGVALGPDDAYVLVNETGSYQTLRVDLTEGGQPAGPGERAVPLTGPLVDRTSVLLSGLPCFPDNLTRGRDRFWLGCFAPRRGIVDAIAGMPVVRRMVWRLPAAVRPNAKRYGHVVAFDGQGKVLKSLQDPTGAFATTTGAVEWGEKLVITSLTEPEPGLVGLPP